MATRAVSGGQGESVASWNQVWRDDVTRQLRESSEAHQQTAIIQERIMGVLNGHGERLDRLENQPDRTRANLTQYGGCSATALMMAFIAFDAVVGLGGLITAIVGLFHH